MKKSCNLKRKKLQPKELSQEIGMQSAMVGQGRREIRMQ